MVIPLVFCVSITSRQWACRSSMVIVPPPVEKLSSLLAELIPRLVKNGKMGGQDGYRKTWGAVPILFVGHKWCLSPIEVMYIPFEDRIFKNIT